MIIAVAFAIVGVSGAAALQRPFIRAVAVASGVMPSYATLWLVEGPQLQFWPPKIEYSVSWMGRHVDPETIEGGYFVLSLPPIRAVIPPEYRVADWTALVPCPPGGSVTFSAQVVGTAAAEMPGDLPVVYVELSPAYADAASRRVISVTVPYNVVLVDSSGEVLEGAIVMDALAAASAVRVEVQDIGGSPWAKRIQVMAP